MSPFQPLPFAYAKRHRLLCTPHAEKEAHLQLLSPVAIQAPVMSEVYRRYGLQVDTKRCSEEEFKDTLSKYYEELNHSSANTLESVEEELDLRSLAGAINNKEDLLEQEDDAPIIRLINGLIAEAISLNASDIHIETFEQHLAVRFRIDGVLQTVIEPDRAMSSLLVSRIKIMAKLDIAEKRIPQDGRISIQSGGKDIDLRVSTMPTQEGERVVMRLLEKNNNRLRLSSLGMPNEQETVFNGLLNKPHGIILVTGPTGSGKTTTLYAGLNELDRSTKNILTIEDPVEYQLSGIGQTQVNNKAGMSFARGLRAILRQDPDVVMIGEIRDLETAEIAIQASLTGHLVISTLHTNTAIGAVNRMIDMGVEPFLLASSLIGLQAQRLVRVLCPHCREERKATTNECRQLKVSYDKEVPLVIFSPAESGCAKCQQRGYFGRTGVYELIPVSSQLGTQIHQGVSERELLDCARLESPSLWDHAIQLVKNGTTSLEEALRVTQEAD